MPSFIAVAQLISQSTEVPPWTAYELVNPPSYTVGQNTQWQPKRYLEQGRIQDFNWGGGGATDYVPPRTLRARNRTHFRQGSRARLRALESL